MQYHASAGGDFYLKRLLVAGGDKRAICLAKLLDQSGYTVETLGLQPDDELDVHIREADVILLPYPYSIKDGLIPSLYGAKISPEEIIDKRSPRTVVIAERGVEEKLTQVFGHLKRYSDAAGFEKRNAELSAEAAVCEAMLRCPLALMDSSVLITGYGLFGRALAIKCKALGATVWVAARREEQRRQAETEGMKSVSIVEMADILPEMNLVFNTIPARIFAEYHLKQIPEECWLFELASSPYGFDEKTAKAAGVSCLTLPGLPARYAPESAALALFEAVETLIREGIE